MVFGFKFAFLRKKKNKERITPDDED